MKTIAGQAYSCFHPPLTPPFQEGEQVAAEVIDHVYEIINTYQGKGNRWYDNDPMMLKGVELLRNAPANVQRVAALKLLMALEQKSFEGVDI